MNRITRDRKEDELDAEKKKLLEEGQVDKAAKLENKRPLHINNVCKVTEERTIIQSNDGSRSDRTKTGETFSVDEYQVFKEEHKALLDRFRDASWEESREMLTSQGHILMDENSNNYFMLTTLEEQMKGNTEMVNKLGRQGQIISQIYQLAEPMKRPPRDLVPRFFEKFERDESRAAFQEGVDHFLKQIAKRAVDKKKEQEEEAAAAAATAAQQQAPAEEELQPVSLVEAMHSMSKEERMGPGGLDPVDVFETLPEELQECFRSGDVEMLKQVAASMDPQEFQDHFQRCIDCGLWSTGGGSS